MRRFVLIATGLLVLGACGAEPDKAAPKAEPNAPTAAAATVAATGATTPAVLTPADERRVCVAGLSAVHGQEPSAIRVEGVADGVVEASWAAPVDGGRRFAECRIVGGRIQWRPTRLPDGQTSTWMTGATDPVITYALSGATVLITQTSPDGTRSQATLAVPAEEEAR